MRVRFLYLLLLVALQLTAEAGLEPCLRLKGVVLDIGTRKPIAAADLFVKTPTGRTRVGKTTEPSGAFELEVKCPATALYIEKTGYRSQMLPLPTLAQEVISEPVFVSIPLVPSDRQATDRPYLQTEQQAYVQEASGSSGSSPQHSTFVISDALTRQPLRAETCFYYTKTAGKKCVTTNDKGTFDIDFTEKDIVAIEVKAPGYQYYQGNLIIEDLNGKRLRHIIGLLKELTTITVQVSGREQGLRCELRSSESEKAIALLPAVGQPGTFTSSELRPQTYQLVVIGSNRQPVHRQTLVVQSGLNHVLVRLTSATTMPPTPPPATTAAPQPTELAKTVPFIQSSFLLTPEAEGILSAYLRFMQENPESKLEVTGHTDNVGDERLNRTLSEFRVRAVASYLIQRGIASDRIHKKGYGSQRPIAPNDTEQNKAKNRRVDLKLIAN